MLHRYGYEGAATLPKVAVKTRSLERALEWFGLVSDQVEHCEHESEAKICLVRCFGWDVGWHQSMYPLCSCAIRFVAKEAKRLITCVPVVGFAPEWWSRAIRKGAPGQSLTGFNSKDFQSAWQGKKGDWRYTGINSVGATT